MRYRGHDDDGSSDPAGFGESGGGADRYPERAEGGLLEIQEDQPIFIGFKLDTSLRRQLESIEGPDRKYVSHEESPFLRVCRVGKDYYVGKLVRERLTTDRVDDIRRNVLSILQRLCPEVRLPQTMEILAGPPESGAAPGEDDRDRW